jgi:hypothetical protein
MNTGGGLDETGFVKKGEHSVAYQLALLVIWSRPDPELPEVDPWALAVAVLDTRSDLPSAGFPPKAPWQCRGH